MKMRSRFLWYMALVMTWCVSATFAQVERTDLEISFSGGLGWSETALSSAQIPEFATTTLSIGLSAKAGYFLSRRLDVGGIIGASYSESDTDSGETDGYAWIIGPGLNFHFRPDTDIVPFLGAYAGLSRGETTSQDFSGERKGTSDGWFAQAQGGADFFLTSHVAIKLQLRYRREDTDLKTNAPFQQVSGDRKVTTDSLGALVGFAIFLDTRR